MSKRATKPKRSSQSPNHAIWVASGVGEAGEALADAVMPKLMVAVAELGDPAFALTVFKEAVYQVYELPKRNAESRARWGWKPQGGSHVQEER